jgi:hypothetical protein
LLRDKTGLVQLISDEMKVEKLKNVTLESCVCIEGKVSILVVESLPLFLCMAFPGVLEIDLFYNTLG